MADRFRWVTIQTIAICEQCSWNDVLNNFKHRKCVQNAKRHHEETGHRVSMERGSIAYYGFTTEPTNPTTRAES